MSVLKGIITVAFVIVCIALVILVLVQEGESGGLNAVSNTTSGSWDKVKNRTAEAREERATRYLVIAFMVLALLLSLSVFS